MSAGSTTLSALSVTGASSIGSLNAGSTTLSSLNVTGTLKSGSSTVSSLSLTTPLVVGSGGSGLGTTPTNGQMLIGNGTNYTLSTLSSTQGLEINNGVGTSSIGFSRSYILPVTYLVVAGGGGGGVSGGGGGGAGGLIYDSQNIQVTSSTQTLSIVVGIGGTGVASGVNGSNSSLSGTGLTTVTATGGGGGGNGAINGQNGGSGGGAAPGRSVGTGIVRQGNSGGSGNSGSEYGVGGGGGAGSLGGNGNIGGANGIGGSGGSGNSISITGVSILYAGGGGGYGSLVSGVAGPGGGGRGAAGVSTTQPTSGTSNTGGGGGGGNAGGTSSGSGGSGIVVLSIPTVYYNSSGVSGGTAGTDYTVSVSGSNTIISFLTVATYTYTVGSYNPIIPIDYLVVAGGGGATNGGGGGGGGGFIRNSQTLTLTSNSSLSVTVGSGGSGGSLTASNGGNSFISGTAFNTITAIGGGSGSYNGNGSSGGSGGGGGGIGGGASANGGAGTTGQGFAGGNGSVISLSAGGGGGGAGAVGSNGSGTTGGAGGKGALSNITGLPKYYAGGGGAWGNSVAAAGGAGGGGAGNTAGIGGSGQANTGGGAGGGGNLQNGGTGGSGIVILSIPSVYYFSGNITGGTLGVDYTVATNIDYTMNISYTVISFLTVGTYTYTIGTGNIIVTIPNNVSISGNLHISGSSNLFPKTAQIYAGYLGAYALTTDSELYSWGDNTNGNLGTATTSNPDLSNVIQFPSYLKNNNTMIPGSESGGGNNTIIDFIAIHTTCYCLWSNGDLYAWGENFYGQFGNGGTTTSIWPIIIAGPSSSGAVTAPIAQIYHCKNGYASQYSTASAQVSMFIRTTSNLFYCAGHNANGTLGLGNVTSPVSTWTALIGPTGRTVTSIFVGSNPSISAFLQCTDNTVWATGYNGVGSLGIGNTTTPISTWTQITTFGTSYVFSDIQSSGWAGSNLQSTAFLTTTGLLFTCGNNNFGQLGIGSVVQTTTPTQISFGGLLVDKLIKTAFCVWVIFTDSSYARWGYNGSGQLGNTSTTNVTSPLHSLSTDPGGRYATNVFSGNQTADTSTNTPVYILKPTGLYFCGYNSVGTASIGNTSINANVTTQTRSIINSLDIQNLVIIGSSNNISVTVVSFNDSNKIYLCGAQNNFMLNTNVTGSKYCFKDGKIY